MSLKLLKEQILPAIFNKEETKFLRCEHDSHLVGEDQFQSSVIFCTAVVYKNNKQNHIPLIVKFEPSNVELRKYLNSNFQFYNEVFMYDKVLPFLNKKNIVEETFPKFYHGVGIIGDSDSNFIVVQDLRPLGYKLTEEKVFLDYKHLFFAINKLGRYHALSYDLKHESPEQFYKLVHSLKETTWKEDSLSFQHLISACFHRAMDPLIVQGKHVKILKRLLNIVDNRFDKFISNLIAPDEPQAVVCHGDFCRNNMLFKYNNNEPIEVKFFDIATARYSSPAIDIGFFLLLNCSKEVRLAHWDELLTAYHNSLSSAIPDVKIPSLEDIRNEVMEKAFYGLVHCSFFLPTILYEKPFETLESLCGLSDEECGLIFTQIGGGEGTRLLSDMVEELIGRGCLTLQHKFLQV